MGKRRGDAVQNRVCNPLLSSAKAEIAEHPFSSEVGIGAAFYQEDIAYTCFR